MDRRQNPLFLSFSLGTWLNTSVRMSVWFPLVLIVLWTRLGFQLGTICGLLLLISVVVHEFFHVYGARWTGGDADEILIWPAGGLAFCQPGPSFRSEFLTTAAGPLANVLLALVTLPAVISSGMLPFCFHPIILPPVMLGDEASGDTLLQNLAVLMFSLNVKLIYLNLLPVYPMDGGRMLQTVMAQWWDAVFVRTFTFWTAMAAAVLIGLVGYSIDPTVGIVLVSVSSFILILNLLEAIQRQLSDFHDDSFLGYDFSQGYTSLEKGAEDRPKRRGMLEQWRENRRIKKLEHEQLERIETATRLDALLEKVHQQGIDALTPAEQRFLKQASERYRNPGK
ncbi:MAG: M50 family metallopeptidase [Planctomycetaceae bacterium]|nr:M50 family metallopeptidase [Planctomycetaceae bacterium]